MTAFVVPTTWSFFGNTGANQTTYTLPGHTVKQPHLAIFDRKVPSFGGSASQVPSYRIRIIRGVLDANGNLVATRITQDLTCRWPLEGALADVQADIALMATLISDVNLQADIVNQLRLPR